MKAWESQPDLNKVRKKRQESRSWTLMWAARWGRNTFRASDMFVSGSLSETADNLCYKTSWHPRRSTSPTHGLTTRPGFFPFGTKPPAPRRKSQADDFRCLSWLQPEVSLNQSTDLRDAKQWKEHAKHSVTMLSMTTDTALDGETGAAYKFRKSEAPLGIPAQKRDASDWPKSR